MGYRCSSPRILGPQVFNPIAIWIYSTNKVFKDEIELNRWELLNPILVQRWVKLRTDEWYVFVSHSLSTKPKSSEIIRNPRLSYTQPGIHIWPCTVLDEHPPNFNFQMSFQNSECSHMLQVLVKILIILFTSITGILEIPPRRHQLHSKAIIPTARCGPLGDQLLDDSAGHLPQSVHSLRGLHKISGL